MGKILLIDDMTSVRSAIATVLRGAGHDVEEAGDGRSGLEKIRNGRYDVVVTDIVMPIADGTEIVLELKKQNGAPPVIAMSGGGAGVPANDALGLARSKADKCLIKPFENDDLLNAIEELC